MDIGISGWRRWGVKRLKKIFDIIIERSSLSKHDKELLTAGHPDNGLWRQKATMAQDKI